MALQALFQMDMSGVDAKRAVATVFAENGVEEDTFTRILVESTSARLPEIDAKIQQFAIDWKLDRMSCVDRNVLRLAAYEILFPQEDVPSRVAINEAVELAKKFSTEESAKFVNGILGAMVK
jgi:N utilization substance protein B